MLWRINAYAVFDFIFGILDLRDKTRNFVVYRGRPFPAKSAAGLLDVWKWSYMNDISILRTCVIPHDHCTQMCDISPLCMIVTQIDLKYTIKAWARIQHFSSEVGTTFSPPLYILSAALPKLFLHRKIQINFWPKFRSWNTSLHFTIMSDCSFKLIQCFVLRESSRTCVCF